jgi:hypothetical protein
MQIDLSEKQRRNVSFSSRLIWEPGSNSITSTSSASTKQAAVKTVRDAGITMVGGLEPVLSRFSRRASAAWPSLEDSMDATVYSDRVNSFGASLRLSAHLFA